MKIHSIRAENFGPYHILEETRLGEFTTIVGENDAGKSHILHAVKVFLDDKSIEKNHIYDGCNPGASVIIEIAFTDIQEKFEIEDGVETTLQDEMLIDKKGLLRITKVYSQSLYEIETYIETYGFNKEDFRVLSSLKRDELNALCKSYDINFSMYGPGATNTRKRGELRAKARELNIQLSEGAMPLTGNLRKKIFSFLPKFRLFETSTIFNKNSDIFRDYLSPIVDKAVEDPEINSIKNKLVQAIDVALAKEMGKISKILQEYMGDSHQNLRIRSNFYWHKAVEFDIIGRDNSGVEVSIDSRGSGIKRLFMVAFFQYLSEIEEEIGNLIISIEEPENCLHPRLQRELARALRHLADKGYQIILTSHSPVFAGESPIEDVILVKRIKGKAETLQHPNLDPDDIAKQLGIEPSDQIAGYRACVFLEGPTDIIFWQAISSKLKEGSIIDADLEDKKIGLIFHGGETLKYWINTEAVKKLNRHFAVIIDSDRKNKSCSIPEKKLNWEREVKALGGKFFITRKREIENYIHPDAIKRAGHELKDFDEFSDMKEMFGKNVSKIAEDMSCEEILAMDLYKKNGVEHHELKEIIEDILALPGNDINSSKS
jgi:putative ATP-dependent endonuclease of the OLD family